MSDAEAERNIKTSTSSDSPKKEKVQANVLFSDVWKKTYSFIRSVPNNNYKAHCTLCQKDFSHDDISKYF